MTINFSVLEDVRQEFNQLFCQENKGAILTKLMQQAIADKKPQQQRQLAVDKILELRVIQTPISAHEVELARAELHL